MRILKRITVAVLCLAVVLSSVFCMPVFAASTAYINGTSVRVRASATTKSTEVAKLSNVYVTVNSTVSGEQVSSYGDTWYNITYGGITGYVYGEYVRVTDNIPDTPIPSLPSANAVTDVKYVSEKTDLYSGLVGSFTRIGSVEQGLINVVQDGPSWVYVVTHDGKFGYIPKSVVIDVPYSKDWGFDEVLAQFPDNYRTSLMYLHTKHSNWKFVPQKLSITLADAIKNEAGRKIVPQSINPPSDWITSTGITTLEPGYAGYATGDALRYFMSPENFLDDKCVFLFLPHTYDASNDNYQTVKSVVQGSFLNTDFYINTLLTVAKELNLSSSVLAGNLLQEQGYQGTSDLISGSYPGFEGYYNFFNVGASGANRAEIITSGLTYAKNHGWNSPYAAIKGGAAFYANDYVNAGQNSYYYMDFNVINQTWWKQYATNIDDARAKATLLAKGFDTNSNASLTFKIPVFADALITPIVVDYPTPPTAPLSTGDGALYGDVDKDEQITVNDLALIRMCMLNIKPLSEEEYAIAARVAEPYDKVSVADLAAIRLHLLGIKKITE